MKKINNGDVWIFNLLNGSEIIGTVDDQDDKYFYLKNALLFVTGKDRETGAPYIGLQPPCTFGEPNQDGQDLAIPASSLAYPYQPNTAVLENYGKMISKLVIAPANFLKH